MEENVIPNNEIDESGNPPEIQVNTTPLTEIELLRWENQLLKREKALTEKEKFVSFSINNIFDKENDAPNSFVEPKPMKIGINEVKTLLMEFNPSQNAITAKNWIDSIEGLKSLYEWDDRTALLYATLRLGGSAYYWYQSKHDVIRTFREFKEELLSSFPSGQNDASILIQIMERKRLAGEAIEDYAYQVAALGKRIKVDETSIVKYIISGLSNQSLVNVAMTSNCNNIPALLKVVKNFEEIEKQGQVRHQLAPRIQPSTSQGLTKHTSRFQPFRNHRNFTSRNEREYRGRRWSVSNNVDRNNYQKDNLVCFKCNGRGHYAKDCTFKNLRCFRCQQRGHVSRDCKVKQVSRLNTTQEGTSKSRDEYHQIVYIEDQPVFAYFDLGSECSTLKQEIVKQKAWDIAKCDVKLIGFGNKKTNVVGKVQQNVRVSDINLLIDIMVVDDAAQNFPMILGRNYLDRPDIEILKKWKTFEVHHKKTKNLPIATLDPSEKIEVGDISVDSAA